MTKTEAKRLQEQTRLDQLKTAEERNCLGQFATPPTLSLDLAKYAASLWVAHRKGISFLDPAFGTGSFYSAFRQTFPSKLLEDACGIEIDPTFADCAASLWRDTGLRLIKGDFTAITPDRQYNLILTNPPYVRHHHLNHEEKVRLKRLVFDQLGIDVSGLAGLYSYFLLLGNAWLAEEGLAIWLIPSEFMDVNYGLAIKDYLTSHVKLLHVHRYCPSDAQFCDALVTSSVVAFEKIRPPANHNVRMSFGGSLSAPNASEMVPLSTLRSIKKWTRFPSNGVILREHDTTLGDLFSIKRGLATGANDFFILQRDKARKLEIPEHFLRPILPSSRYLKDNVIEADTRGFPLSNPSLVLIDCNLPEDEVRAKHPSFWAYLEKGKRQDIHTRYLASRRTPWYSQERREPAPFLCSYMGRKGAMGNPFRFFWNKSHAIAANVYLMLYPKEPLRSALAQNPDLYEMIFFKLREIAAGHLISLCEKSGMPAIRAHRKPSPRQSRRAMIRSCLFGATLFAPLATAASSLTSDCAQSFVTKPRKDLSTPNSVLDTATNAKTR